MSTDDLDFSAPAPRKPAPPPAAPAQPAAPVYNIAMALEFFRSSGKAEGFAQGAVIFAEDEKSGGFLRKKGKMYVVVTGEVEFQVQGKAIGTARSGGIFGEMAVIAQAARTASAVAKTACTVIGLDDKQFEASLQAKPEFALALMSIMNQRMRSTISRLHATRTLHAGEAKESGAIDTKLFAGLQRLLASQKKAVFAKGAMIMQEGTPGATMFIVAEGSVAISIKAGIVGRVGAGGVFGEMALVDQSVRTASALAETDCALLSINRETFLQLVKTSPAFGASILAAIAARATDLAERGK